jgi:hypothetical protein
MNFKKGKKQDITYGILLHNLHLEHPKYQFIIQSNLEMKLFHIFKITDLEKGS